jgi:metal-responsive CopG/Arc/MetJ family transcriptional regulator
MSHRVNVIFDDNVWEQLEEIPKGERSKLINEAVSETLLRRKRQEAFDRIRARAAGKEKLPGTTEEWVREDRDSHL